MSRVAERNSSGRYYVNARLSVARTKTDADFPEFGPDTQIYRLLSDLIEVKAKGFRGIVVTALTGLHLNPAYDPLDNFYSCNPRSIFEGGIWDALQENRIPCGKSDPLNVAKNINELNEAWAKGRRPQSAALAVVHFLREVTKAEEPKRTRLVEYFFFRLWKYAESISSYELAVADPNTSSRYDLAHSLVGFTLKYPESGTTPQMLVGELLAAVFSETKIEVRGGGESVFGTNTTSKKPADIWLEVAGQETNLYEVTVKPVSRKRLDDSIDALISTGHIDKSVTFICRIPEDVYDLEVKNGVVDYKGKKFGVIDYKGFCLSLSALLTNDSFEKVVANVAHHMTDLHISMNTKIGWNEFFASKT